LLNIDNCEVKQLFYNYLYLTNNFVQNLPDSHLHRICEAISCVDKGYKSSLSTMISNQGHYTRYNLNVSLNNLGIYPPQYHYLTSLPFCMSSLPMRFIKVFSRYNILTHAVSIPLSPPDPLPLPTAIRTSNYRSFISTNPA